MDEKEKRIKKIFYDIEFKMIRKMCNCWIKIKPLNPVSQPSRLHLYLNDEYFSWDIYGEDGQIKHIIYFEGFDCIPIFYLNSKKNNFKIKFDVNSIKVIPIEKTMDQKNFKKKSNCLSSKASCWAKDVYYTSRPDKSPFDEM
ncbi:hypothetical protein AYK24_05270 [Thermoplasmatales archaeon SG8-52-4]|nr:MAG: hypothetical protein AYK24_05270 [Thermoplasmatales archaeon SG8-52-4]